MFRVIKDFKSYPFKIYSEALEFKRKYGGIIAIKAFTGGRKRNS